MPTIRIQGTDLSHGEADILTFDEGLIGLAHLRSMVLVRQPSIEPFLWLASIDDPTIAFLVVEPHTLFPVYEPHLPGAAHFRHYMDEGETPVVLGIAQIAANWKHSTINLRAPLFISSRTMSGAQIALIESPYRLNEPLPLSRAA